MSTTTSTAGTSVFRHSIVSLFAAGFISVLLFQMGALAILNAIGFPGAGAPFPCGVTKPMNVPQIWSFAFWGGMWGIVFGALERRFPEGPMYYVASFLFGMIGPVLVLWFIVFPIKGIPMAAGWDINRMIVHHIIHGCSGLGVGVLLKWRAATTA